ncbi:rod-binding protein [Nitratiruptor tergarcus]|uniref:Flagellar protein FlgJ n=1 Tax=Nitratiruptor tergarcus DSM 16512 TaxID=1069081 RepID=A0A1W1WT99_9BACT|nr:rod-binding protein [Nitratiruptor tergarcus]SMC09280.1 flagellar protein FlgJ [Nitratiruptor tergarcus DSM 16512]
MKVEAYWDIAKLSQIKSSQMATKAFEEEFVHMFLKEVRKTLPQGMLLGNSFSSKMYLDMVDMQLAKAISDSDALGIKEYIEAALKEYEKNSK